MDRTGETTGRYMIDAVKCTEWTFENCWLSPELAQFFANEEFSKTLE